METGNYKPKKGVVVLLDALGVSQYDSKQSMKFCDLRDLFVNCAKELWATRDLEFKRELKMNLPEPEIATFQDSIIICWSEQEQKPDFLPIILSAGQWISDAITFAIGNNLNLRGSISYGEYIFYTSNKNVTVIGPAVNEASKYYEKADWIGVIQTPSCRIEYRSSLEKLADRDKVTLEREIQKYQFLFVNYPVPLSVKKINFFSSKKEAYSLRKEFCVSSWPCMACRIEPKVSISKILRDKSISEKPEHQSKYYNTYLFFEWYKQTFWERFRKQPGE